MSLRLGLDTFTAHQGDTVYSVRLLPLGSSSWQGWMNRSGSGHR